jgi:hypothetical protein
MKNPISSKILMNFLEVRFLEPFANSKNADAFFSFLGRERALEISKNQRFLLATRV